MTGHAERFFPTALHAPWRALLIASQAPPARKASLTSRALATVASFGVGLAAIQVGAAGGELVYLEGAASAYTTGAPATGMDEH